MTRLLWPIVGGAVVLALVFGLIFMYGGGREKAGALKQSNTQLSTTIETKNHAQKERATIERRNSGADYPALVDKLR